MSFKSGGDKMYKSRFRAALACRIVGLDRVKFNDAVASGVYPCAPITTAGSARVFTEEQLLPLYFFARLTEFGVLASRAGYLACEVAGLTGTYGTEDSDRIILLRGTNMEHMIASHRGPPGGKIVPYDPLHEMPGRNPDHPEGYQLAGVGRIVFAVEFYINHVRKIIADQIEYECSILGEDDEAG
jgi:hypothetical protein